jgi:hypothetical protein
MTCTKVTERTYIKDCIKAFTNMVKDPAWGIGRWTKDVQNEMLDKMLAYDPETVTLDELRVITGFDYKGKICSYCHQYHLNTIELSYDGYHSEHICFDCIKELNAKIS